VCASQRWSEKSWNERYVLLSNYYCNDMLWSEDQCSALCLWSLDSISCMYEFILLMHKVCLVAEKSELVSMHYYVVVVFSSLYIAVCLGCCFIYLVLAYAIANGVPTAIWAYDDTYEVLLIIRSHDYHSFVIFCFTLQVGHPHMSNLAIFSCYCYFAFFGHMSMTIRYLDYGYVYVCRRPTNLKSRTTYGWLCI